MTMLRTIDDIPAVLSEMTLDEKIRFVTVPTEIHTHALPRFGIPAIQIQDGGTGVNYMHLFEEMEVQGRLPMVDGFNLYRDIPYYLDHPEEGTPEIRELMRVYMEIVDQEYRPNHKFPGCFPPGMTLGATFDPETVYQTAEALGREMDAYKIDVVLGSPNVNIHRVPRNGRLFEGYSEDPCLAATLAPEFVKGIQDAGPAANAKHFAANNQETGRSGIDTHVSERALYEIYFPGFKACVDAGCMTVMSAYNKVNGYACALNKWLLTDVLKNEWGFQGVVDSDWGAVYDQVDGLNAGNDLEQPRVKNHDAVYEALSDGRLTEEQLDHAVERMLRLVLVCPAKKGHRYSDIDRNYSRRAAYRAASESAVLLKNNGVLPLSRNANVCFYGERSKKLAFCGSGSAQVYTDQDTHILPETEKLIGKDHVTFEKILPDTDVIVVTAGADGQEGKDRPDMRLEHKDEEMLALAIKNAKAAGKPVVLLLNVAAPVDLRAFIHDVDAILCIWIPGMEGGRATADILFGKVNPSGKLPLTFPMREEDTPSYLNFPGEDGEVFYGEGIYVGYRYYDKKDIPPMFPFGYGLSYTSFELSNLRISDESWDTTKNIPLKVSLNVTNTGARDGREVIQLYIHDEVSTLDKPLRELKAFKKVTVKAGETVSVDFDLSMDAFSSYDPKLHQWVAEPGWFRIFLGTSSRDLPLSARVRLIGKNPYAVDPSSPAGPLLSSSQAVAVLKKYIPEALLDDLSARIMQFPAMTLANFWRRTVSRSIPGTSSEKNMLRDQMYAELQNIDIVQ